MDCIYSQAKLLQTIPLFEGLDPAKLQALAFVSDHVRYEDGDMLYRVGQDITAVHVILKGRAETLSADDGHVIAVIAPGEVVGSVPVLAESEAPCDVVSRGRTEALLVPRDVFITHLRDNPSMAMSMLRLISRHYLRSSMNPQFARNAFPARPDPLNA
jgi:CRP-like cAMP-binding protein